MNSYSHRLIFNPSRGGVMAVAETSRSCGKSGASGTTRSKRTKLATGYWMRESELAILKTDPCSMANKLGLPPGIQVKEFDVFQITPRSGAVAFESRIAPTTVNGVPDTTGGAKQTIVVDRNQFTPPVKTGSIKVD